ncbi:MAG: quercetin 2,3-dioxygenase [Gammaproteobacteria bacterium HGW-Gammaproteobacteria-14]|nr:MAG: quercetin 2,3-dioxygenase [Gammaproteobacteria bacterium HGW-Gammaproteobacteria-14]
MTSRPITRVIAGMNTSDGAGVKLRRTLGQSQLARMDPFLMLDEFSSDNADDYIAGFPSHPHRGFETVTYMLDGHMLHEDHMGNRGDLRPGDVQWMTCGRGIIHSEMPQQKEGRMRGFQLWLNLPAKDKMQPAAYRDVPAATMPWHSVDEHIRIKMIAGNLTINNTSLQGPIQAGGTEPVYADIEIAANQQAIIPLPVSHNAFIYVFEGTLSSAGKAVPQHAAALLGSGDNLQVTTGDEGARFLLIAGKPLNEPVVQYGPFVMNSAAEIEQALRDYRDGTLTNGGVTALGA